ncbi:hypothetical protein IscW_ISCW011527 [Ixodes scapularis]|uniref:Uncharacterized protein n=1 Tax=Ixodes scapularis TaxID=6945 RepID=B7Q9L3_IXOSC|nr:hypothetical protein IscW_ISCW011527 [Ixodes scapularis]|eukprot:XP_002412513.1 hypothetical protein IscW_ISCW011527 [Ixodes scapularis]
MPYITENCGRTSTIPTVAFSERHARSLLNGTPGSSGKVTGAKSNITGFIFKE